MEIASEMDLFDPMNLELLKIKIEKMGKTQHIEILKILKKNVNAKLNENKSGVYINLSFLPKETISEINEYVNYIMVQEDSLCMLEVQKSEYKKSYFLEKEDKDEATIPYSTTNYPY